MKKNHLLIMLLRCLVPVLVMAAIVLLRVPISSVIWFAFILLCPISHVLMMRFMMQDEHDHSTHSVKPIARERLDLKPHLPSD